MKNAVDKQVFIVIDSGFSLESLRDAKVLAVRDLERGVTVIGAPTVGSGALESFAYDPLSHGSIVLQRLRAQAPEVPVILIRAIGADGRIIRTGWNNGNVASDGWTEAYLWAVALCKQRGLTSVANCSFGGITHAADGTGWESHQLSQVLGKDKSGHVLVAAAGPGDGRAVHASWRTPAGSSTWVSVTQNSTTAYNFWAGTAHQQWWLTVRSNGEVAGRFDGAGLDANMWNGRQQLTFEVQGDGNVTMEFTLSDSADKLLRCDCWVRGESSARFDNYVDSQLIVEPAVYPQVIAVGFQHGSYAPDQNHEGAKPDVLVSGTGEISFRTPEVTATVARLLSDDATLDVDKVRQLLGGIYGK